MDPKKVDHAENYLKENQGRFPVGSLKNALLAGGYTEDEINEAEKRLKSQSPSNNNNPFGIDALFSKTWNSFTKNLPLTLIPLISSIPWFILGLLFALFNQDLFKRLEEANRTMSNQPAEDLELIKEICLTFIYSPLYLSITVLGIFLGILGTIALYRGIIFSDQDKKISLFEAYKESLPLFFPFILVSLLQFLAIFSGFILLIIPGIIFAIWFMFSQFSLLAEDERGRKALKRSKGLVKGKWWSVFGRVVLFFILITLASLPVSILNFIPLLGSSISIIFSALQSVFTAIFIYEMFKALKTLKEQKGGD